MAKTNKCGRPTYLQLTFTFMLVVEVVSRELLRCFQQEIYVNFLNYHKTGERQHLTCSPWRKKCWQFLFPHNKIRVLIFLINSVVQFSIVLKWKRKLVMKIKFSNALFPGQFVNTQLKDYIAIQNRHDPKRSLHYNYYPSKSKCIYIYTYIVRGFFVLVLICN